MKFYLKVKSYHPAYIEKFCTNITKNLITLYNLKLKSVKLPKKIEHFTVLRSPHVDKKARDQFERITYKRLLIIEAAQTENLFKWISESYKNNIGIQLELKMHKNV